MFTPAKIKTCKQFLNNTVHLDMTFQFLGENAWLLSIAFRECHQILPYLWVNLSEYLASQQMEVKIIKGDGFCFLNAVSKVLEVNYNHTFPVQKAMEQIMKFLCENFNKYTAYHQQKSEPTPGDTLISDVIDFFASRNYNTNIVDLLMQITTDALRLNLNIYQKNNGQIQIYNFTSPEPLFTVNLKFSHDPLHPQGNHYDAITRLPILASLQHLLNLSAFKPWDGKKTRAYIPPPKVEIIDLTDDDQSISLGKNSIYGGTTDNYSFSDETYISSEPECLGSGKYCMMHTTTPRTTSTFSSPTPSTPTPSTSSEAHSDTTYSSYTSQLFPMQEIKTLPTYLLSMDGTTPGPNYLTEYLANEDVGDSDVESVMERDPDDELESLIQSVSHGRPFPTWYFNSIPPQWVTKIPENINGIKHYRIKIHEHLWHAPTSDRRHFRMLTSSREGFMGERRIGTCKGSFVCNNQDCPFIKTSQCHQPNKVSWQNVCGNLNFKVCTICDHVAQRIYCGAKKLIEYDYSTKVATVYHLGNHKCWPQLSNRNSSGHGQLVIPQGVTGSAKQVGLRQIVKLIDAGNMDAAEKEAEVWIDRRKVKWQMEAMNPQEGMDHNSFDAVGIVKQKTDTKDPFYIYKIGNKNLGGGSDYVFKSSTKLAKIAIQMDVNGEPNLLQLENAYFDATHTRVYGFKSLGMWLLHPAMKKMLRLASMEIRSENYRDIALFLTLFNEMLATVKNEPGYKFNPRYFVCDEAGANYKAIAEVYGTEFAAIRVKGCQWHFKSDVKNHVSKLQPPDQESFIQTCNSLCDVTTVSDYNRLNQVLDLLADRNPEIKPFILYWEPRKSHIFKPFRGTGLPGVNLSEQGNASFKPAKTMRLVHAAKYDVATMLEQEKEIELFERNLLKCAGRGPSAGVRNSKDRAQQIKVAEDFVNILDDEEDVLLEATQGNNPEMFIPKAQSKHRAPKRFLTKPPGKAPPRKSQKKKEEVCDEKALEAKLAMAMGVTDSELTSGRKNKIDNPPMLVPATWRICKCRGCKQAITPEEKAYPHSFVFRRRGVVGYFNRLHNKWVDSEQNIHFHLNMTCVRKHDATIEKRHLSCNDELFCGLSKEEMVYLHEQGFLKPIAEKKME